MQQDRRQGEDGLERLRERAGRIVGDYAHGGELPVPRAEGTASGRGRRAVVEEDSAVTGRRYVVENGGLPPSSRQPAVVEGGGAVTVNVSLSGGPIFLDDERRIRALAKEIKRLIGEDGRRGLGVGG